MFNNKFRVGVLKHPGYNGKSGGSVSTPQDFFGKGKRAPYESLLNDLLLGGTVGGTEGHYEGGKGGGPHGKTGGTWVPGQAGVSLMDFVKQQPGYQFGLNTGVEALNRTYAATGQGYGGSQAVALQDFGNKYAGQAYQQLISNLMGPAGANMNPAQSSQTQGTSPLGDVLGAVTSFGLGKIFPSDKNLKTNIKHINTINGIKIYSFNYIWSYIKSVGVMAQDLLEMPEYKHAVHTTNIGYVVDYSKLPI